MAHYLVRWLELYSYSTHRYFALFVMAFDLGLCVFLAAALAMPLVSATLMYIPLLDSPRPAILTDCLP